MSRFPACTTNGPLCITNSPEPQRMEKIAPAGKTNSFSCVRVWDFLRVEMGFVKEFAYSPFHVGSICPSSRVLAGQLVRTAREAARNAWYAPDTGLFIDLGAGPGPVTGELLRAGITPERIVAVERSPSFAKTFQKRYRQVPILTGDAANLRQMLAVAYPDSPVAAVISSLPFRAIPKKITSRILWELHETLVERGGVLVQYSYVWWLKHILENDGFTPKLSRLVLQNVPPARAESYVTEPEFRARLML